MVKKKMVKKTAVRKQNSKKTRTRKEPSSSQLFSKVIAVSESTKTISSEIKNMTKIFKENQKILVAMNDMIDTLSSSMIQIQKQSKQINIIEEDTERLISGLNQMKGNTKIITKLNEQTVKLEEKIKSIEQSQKSTTKTDELDQTVSESLDSIRNNSKMIMKVADRVDDLKEDIKSVAKETNSTSGITPSGNFDGSIVSGKLLAANNTSTICPYAASVFVLVTFTNTLDFSASVN